MASFAQNEANRVDLSQVKIGDVHRDAHRRLVPSNARRGMEEKDTVARSNFFGGSKNGASNAIKSPLFPSPGVLHDSLANVAEGYAHGCRGPLTPVSTVESCPSPPLIRGVNRG